MSYKATVIVDSIWIRKEPNTSAEKLGVVKRGQEITFSEKHDKWYKFEKGWVSSKGGGQQLLKIEGEETSEGDNKNTESSNSSNEKEDNKDEKNNVEEGNFTYIKDYFDTKVANSENEASNFLKNVRGIHGMPYQFMNLTDIRLPGSNFGRKYSEKIISKMPLLLLTPGKPKFMADYNSKDKKDLLSYALHRGGKDESIIDALVNGDNGSDGKFYSFEFAYKEYYACVNPMLQRIARFLNIHDKELDGKKLSSYSWENYANDAFKGFVSSKETVAFYLDSETQISETFSNSTTESGLASAVNGLSDMGREMQFLLGGVAGIDFDVLKEDKRADVLANFESFTNKYASILPTHLMNKLANGFVNVATGGKMIFPEIWQDSDFSRSYNLNIKLRTPETDKFSWYMNIAVPLIHLICLAAPHQLGANGYQAPFLVRGYYKGFFNCDMGIITNMDIQKGDKGKWTIDGLPTVVDVSISMKDLYQIMTLTRDDNVIDLLKNTALLDYLANMCGININKPDMARTLDIYYTQIVNRVTDIVTFNGFLGVEQTLSNLVGSIFRK